MRNFKRMSTYLSGLAFLVGALMVPSGAVLAQDDDEMDEIVIEEIITTGDHAVLT